MESTNALPAFLTSRMCVVSALAKVRSETARQDAGRCVSLRLMSLTCFVRLRVRELVCEPVIS